MLSPAQQQLKDINLKEVMGPHGKDPDFDAKLEDLSTQLWQNYLTGRVMDELMEEDQEEFARLAGDSDISQDTMIEFLQDKFPDLDEAFQLYVIENKAETIQGRVEELKAVFEDNQEQLELLRSIERLIDQEDWKTASEQLIEKFSEVGLGYE